MTAENRQEPHTTQRVTYTPPRLEQHGRFEHITGVSLPLNTSSSESTGGQQ